MMKASPVSVTIGNAKERLSACRDVEQRVIILRKEADRMTELSRQVCL